MNYIVDKLIGNVHLNNYKVIACLVIQTLIACEKLICGVTMF